MSFDMNKPCGLTNNFEVYQCLNAWCKKVPSLKCQLDVRTNAFVIQILEGRLYTTVNVKEVMGTHKYVWINEITQSGLTNRYTLDIEGSNVDGNRFEIAAFLQITSEDGGKTWPECGLSSSQLTWKSK